MAPENPELEKLLVIGQQWPEPHATAAGLRMLQLLRNFRESGCDLTFASSASQGLYGTSLEVLGIRSTSIRMNHASFDRFLIREGFTTVIFDRFITEEQFGWRVRQALPAARLILDTEDLHALRHSRERAVARGTGWTPKDWVADPLFARELASIYRCDLSLIISMAEMDLLMAHVPSLEGKLLYFPFQMSLPAGKQPSFGQREGFVFVGNGKHRPNLDAIAFLHERVWPGLSREFPGATLSIYGAYLPQNILDLNTPEEGFKVRGWIPDLRPVMQGARLQLAPLRFGAGIKGKLLTALAYGLPSLSTPMGWEGILPAGGESPWQAESPESFIRKATALYRDGVLWERTLQELTGAAAPHFSSGNAPFNAFLKHLRGEAGTAGRETLILQRLLRDQAFDRLRYLSKWIEAKESQKN